jgi:hypothetical protein
MGYKDACVENARAWISHKINIRHPGQLKKMKILGAVLELPSYSTANPAHLPQNWAKLAVLFSW